jgi:hypothetical protein
MSHFSGLSCSLLRGIGLLAGLINERMTKLSELCDQQFKEVCDAEQEMTDALQQVRGRTLLPRMVLLEIAELAVTIATANYRLIAIGLTRDVVALQAARIILTAGALWAVRSKSVQRCLSSGFALSFLFVHVILLCWNNDAIDLLKRGFAG